MAGNPGPVYSVMTMIGRRRVVILIAGIGGWACLAGCGPRRAVAPAEAPATPPRGPAHASIVDAFGSTRLIEPRLTGGFLHGPCLTGPAAGDRLLPAARCGRGGIDEGLDFAHLARVRAEVEADGDGVVAGLWSLLAATTPRSAERAVAELRRAAAASPDPGLWSDLAAALAVEGRLKDDPRPLIEALDWVERALEGGPGLPEGLFNRALILDDLGLRSAAAAAWLRFAEVDGGSAWRTEAMARARQDEAGRGRRLEVLLAQLRAGDASAAATAVGIDRRVVRELALDELLPEWAESRQAGDRERSAALFAALETLGPLLRRASGDGTVEAAVEAIRRAAAAGEPAELRLAEAHRHFRQGRRLILQSRYGDARRDLEAALRAAEGLGSPVGLWAAYWLAAADSTTNDYAGALEREREVRRSHDLRDLPSLDARLHWLRGLVEFRTGFFAESLDRFLAAAAIYRRMGEPALEGAALALSAESYHALGQDDEAWVQRVLAFRRLAGEPSGYLHNLLLDAAAASREAGSTYAAAALQGFGLDNARQLGSESREVESLLWRARIWSAGGRADLAEADLGRAWERVERLEDDELRRRLSADLHEANGMLILAGEPASAREHLTEAIRAYEAIDYTYRLPALYLGRARGSLALAETEGAEADLERGIRELERRDRRLGGEVFRQEHFEQAQESFETMIGLLLDQGRPVAALAFAERARASSLRSVTDAAASLRGEPAAPDPHPLADEAALSTAARRLPAQVALLEFAVLPGRVVVWRMADGKVDHWTSDVAAGELRRRVAAVEAAIVGGGSRRDVQSAGGTLFSDLLAPALDGLEGGSHLVIVPDRALAKVPFGALVDPRTGRYLIEDFVVSSALSVAHALGSGQAAAPRTDGEPGGRVVLVGDPLTDGTAPRLEGARREVRQIGGLYPGALLLEGAGADKASVVRELGDAGVFHYAGHAVNDERSPWASYLALAPGASDDGGRLYARDLFGRRLPRLRLAVLSACSTSGAREERTMAVSGLGFAFLDAGAEAVLVNLWDVEDGAAGPVLVSFHRRVAAGEPAPAALRAAILESLSRNPEADPSDWAALILWTRSGPQGKEFRWRH